MRYIALFLWLIPPAALCLAIWLYGTPHVVLSYRFHDNGRQHDPLAHRVYISCDYLGWHGWRTVAAQNGECPWVRFFHREGS